MPKSEQYGYSLDSGKPIIILEAKNSDTDFYSERTDRNYGWITSQEQLLLKNSTIGIAGCGGMGGLLASIFTRLGVGEVRIADSETFDISNINRQFGAGRNTVGKSKAVETARLVREIAEDTKLVVFTEGVNEDSVDEFITGCDIICDEIEVLAVTARLLLHERARKIGVSLFNCNTVGFSTNLFLYEPDGFTFEEAVGLTRSQAEVLEKRVAAGDQAAIDEIVDRMISTVVPILPDYSPGNAEINSEAFFRRLKIERKAPIIATNPSMAGGFLADRVLLYLLEKSGVTRNTCNVPKMPGYLHFDAATMVASVVANWHVR